MVIGIGAMGISENRDTNKEYASFTTLNNGRVSGIYVNGIDVTDKRQRIEKQIKANIQKYLQIEERDVECIKFCMLENDGVTVEIKAKGNN